MGNSRSGERWDKGEEHGVEEKRRARELISLAETAVQGILETLEDDAESKALLEKTGEEFDHLETYPTLICHLVDVVEACKDDAARLVAGKAMKAVLEHFTTPCPQMLYTGVLSCCAQVLTNASEKARSDPVQMDLIEVFSLCSYLCCFKTEWVQLVKTKTLPSPRFSQSMPHFKVLVRKFLPALLDSFRIVQTSQDFHNVLLAVLSTLGGCLYHLHEFRNHEDTLRWFSIDTDGLSTTLDVVATASSGEILSLSLSLLTLSGKHGYERVFCENVVDTVVNTLLELSVKDMPVGETREWEVDVLSNFPDVCIGARTARAISVRLQDEVPSMPSALQNTFQMVETFLSYTSWDLQVYTAKKLLGNFTTAHPRVKQLCISLLVGRNQDLDTLASSFPEFLLTSVDTLSQYRWISLLGSHSTLELFLWALANRGLVRNDTCALLCMLVVESPPEKPTAMELQSLAKALLQDVIVKDWILSCCTLAILDSCLAESRLINFTAESFRACAMAVAKIGFSNQRQTRQACTSLIPRLLYHSKQEAELVQLFFSEVRSLLGNLYGSPSSSTGDHSDSEEPIDAMQPSCSVFVRGLEQLTDLPTLEYLWTCQGLCKEMLHFVDAYAQRHRRHETAVMIFKVITKMFSKSERVKAFARNAEHFCEFGSILASCTSSQHQAADSLRVLFGMLFDGNKEFAYDDETGFSLKPANNNPVSSVRSYSKVAKNPDALDAVLVFLSETPARGKLFRTHALAVIAWLVKPSLQSATTIQMRNNDAEQEHVFENSVNADHQRLFCFPVDQKGPSVSSIPSQANPAPMSCATAVSIDESRVNATMFCQLHQSVVLQLLSFLEECDPAGQQLSCEIIVALGKCQTSVRQVKALFRRVWSLSSRGKPDLCTSLVKCINSVLDEDSPYIYFDGMDSGLSILIEGTGSPSNSRGFPLAHRVVRWPSQESFSFSAWILDHQRTQVVDRTSPFSTSTFFALRSRDGRSGISLVSDLDGLLVAQTIVNGTLHVAHTGIQLKRSVWYHIVAVFQRGRSTSLLRTGSDDSVHLYVNGQLACKTSLPFSFYRKRHSFLGSWTIGADTQMQNRFHGCMRRIEFWAEPLELRQVNQVYRGVERTRGMEQGLVLRLEEFAVTGDHGTFLDTSPSPKRILEDSLLVATNFPGVGTRACWRRGARKALLAVGGMSAVVPLLALECSGELAGCVLYLLGKLLSSGPALHRSRRFIRDGVSVVSYLLSRLSVYCIDQVTLQGAFYLVQKLESDWLLFQQAVREIMLHLAIWSKAQIKSQPGCLAHNAITLTSLACAQPNRARRVVGIAPIVNELFSRDKDLAHTHATAAQSSESGLEKKPFDDLAADDTDMELDINIDLNEDLDPDSVPSQAAAGTATGDVNPTLSSSDLDIDVSLCISIPSSVPEEEFSPSIRARLRALRGSGPHTPASVSIPTQERMVLMIEEIVSTTKARSLEDEEQAALRALIVNTDIDCEVTSPLALRIVSTLVKLDPKSFLSTFVMQLHTPEENPVLHGIGGDMPGGPESDVGLSPVPPGSLASKLSLIDDTAYSQTSLANSPGKAFVGADFFLWFLTSERPKTVLAAMDLFRVLHTRKMLTAASTPALWHLIGMLLCDSLKETTWTSSELDRLVDLSFGISVSRNDDKALTLSFADGLAVLLRGPLRGLDCSERKCRAASKLLELLTASPRTSCQVFLKLSGWHQLLLQSICLTQDGTCKPCECCAVYFDLLDVLHSYDLFRHALEVAKRPDRRQAYRSPLAIEKTLECLFSLEEMNAAAPWLSKVLLIRFLDGAKKSLAHLRDTHLLTVGHAVAKLVMKLISKSFVHVFVDDLSLGRVSDCNGLDNDHQPCASLDFGLLLDFLYPSGTDSVLKRSRRDTCLFTEVFTGSLATSAISGTVFERVYTSLICFFAFLDASPLRREPEHSLTDLLASGMPESCKCRSCALRIEISRLMCMLLAEGIHAELGLSQQREAKGEERGDVSESSKSLTLFLAKELDSIVESMAMLGLSNMVPSGLRRLLGDLFTVLNSFKESTWKREVSGFLLHAERCIPAASVSGTGSQSPPPPSPTRSPSAHHSSMMDLGLQAGEWSPISPSLPRSSSLGPRDEHHRKNILFKSCFPPLSSSTSSRYLSRPSEISHSSLGSVFGIDSAGTMMEQEMDEEVMLSAWWVGRLRDIHESALVEEARERREIGHFRVVTEHLAAMKWKEILKQVTHERGTWGDGKGEGNIYWKLDSSETARTRSRIRLRPNASGTDHRDASAKMRESQGPQQGGTHQYEQTGEELFVAEDVAGSRKSRMNLYRELSLARAFGRNFFLNPPEDLRFRSSSLTSLPIEQDLSSALGQSQGDNSNQRIPQVSRNRSPSHQAVLVRQHVEALAKQHMEQAGKDPRSLFMDNVEMITAQEIIPGTLEITKSQIKFLRSKSESRRDGSLGIGKRWQFRNVRRAQRRRYRMKWTAMELFTGVSERKSYFVNFSSSTKCESALKLIGKAIRQEDAQSLPEERLKKSGVQEAWVHGKISNYEYLMYLNDIASRSYNDLAQYPIMPWVLKDFKSEELDLQNPDSFRNFLLPIGAQSEEKQAELLFKYSETQRQASSSIASSQSGSSLSLFKWPFPTVFGRQKEAENAQQEDENVLLGPPWHFGSFYSSRAIVLWYLLRLEPFTSLHVELQGNKFDHADRQFSSVEMAFRFATTIGPRELIPEFFCTSEFLRNSSGFDLGTKQDGTQLDDVELPPWAGGDPEKFIRFHREALESDYVSANLHHWIDLTYGCKQRGPGAEDSLNVYFHLMYEGAVDLDYLEGIRPDLHRTVLKMIDEYGQCPPMLFNKPHPAKGKGALRRLQAVFRPNLACRLGASRYNRVFNPIIHAVHQLGKSAGELSATLERNADKRRLVWISPHLVCRGHSSALPSQWKLGKSSKEEDWSGASVLGSFIMVDASREVKLLQMVYLPSEDKVYSREEVLCELGIPFAFTSGIGPHMFAMRLDQAKELSALFSPGVLDRRSGTTRDGSSSDAFGATGDGRNLVSLYGTGFWDASFRSFHLELESKTVLFASFSAPDSKRKDKEKKSTSRRLYLSSSTSWTSTMSSSSSGSGGSGPSSSHRYAEDGIYKEHSDTTTCVAVTEDGTRVVTGSMDCCVCVWRVVQVQKESGSAFLQTLGIGADPLVISSSSSSSLTSSAPSLKTSNSSSASSSSSSMPSSMPSFSSGFEERGGSFPGSGTTQLRLDNVLLGHDDVVTAVAVNASLDLVFSASLDGTCIIHTLDTGSYLRSIQIESSVSQLSSSGFHSSFSSSMSGGWMWVGISDCSTAVLNVWNEGELGLYSFSVNGRPVSSRRCTAPMYCFSYSYDGRILACATKQHVVVLFDAVDLALLHQTEPMKTAITSISCFSDKYVFILGFADGSIANLRVFG